MTLRCKKTIRYFTYFPKEIEIKYKDKSKYCKYQME